MPPVSFFQINLNNNKISDVLTYKLKIMFLQRHKAIYASIMNVLIIYSFPKVSERDLEHLLYTLLL